MDIDLKIIPELDPDFVPAVLWNNAYKMRVAESSVAQQVTFALLRPDFSCSHYNTDILPSVHENEQVTFRYLERLLKFLLWQRGACTVLVAGGDGFVEKMAAMYSEDGARAFDAEFFGKKVYLHPFEIRACSPADLPEVNERSMPQGGHFDGCRIGFDLGGSDRKCAAVMDGRVLYSEELEWDPYFESNPEFHIAGINDSIERAAAHLPRVDAIGGCAAGVYVENEVRAASLFRGISPELFESKIRRLFFDLQAEWGQVPFDVVNDGEVTALAGSMSMKENAVLGIAMGTSEAVGYVTPEGSITSMLNELAFAPVDYCDDAPVDEWSGDLGCGAQYFSQQAVARLAPLAGIELPANLSLPDRLIAVQQLMAANDERAMKIYSTMGVYLGYAIAHYTEFYEIRKVLLLGRVTSGPGGSLLLAKAVEVLATCFPELAEKIELVMPNEKDKRHGQAVAAASLPIIPEI